MPVAEIDGITTYYEVAGSGPPLLMFSPGGFNGSLDNWRSLNRYTGLKMLDHLTERFTCIAFDRRESGASGGRIERVTWDDYAEQGRGLLLHLGIDKAHLLGGCVGCSIAVALAVKHRDCVSSMVLFSPAGGVKYRMAQHARFGRHLAYVEEHGLAQVVALVNSSRDGFTQDPRVGPWATVIRAAPPFAVRFGQQDQSRYLAVVAGLARIMFDRDTVPGAEPEDLLRLDVPTLVVPGQDASHATSAARYLQECLPAAEYWDVPVSEQTEGSVNARLLQFLEAQP